MRGAGTHRTAEGASLTFGVGSLLLALAATYSGWHPPHWLLVAFWIVGILFVAGGILGFVFHARRAPVPAEAPQVQHIVTSINQRDGITAHTVNIAPEKPSASAELIERNAPDGQGHYVTRYGLTIKESTSVSRLHLFAVAPSIVAVENGPPLSATFNREYWAVPGQAYLAFDRPPAFFVVEVVTREPEAEVGLSWDLH